MAKTASAAKTKKKRASEESRKSDAREAPARSPDSEESERQLGSWISRALPVVSVGGALVVGVTTSVGPAILVLAAGALLGAIALLWASMRTLGGDAPLARDLEAVVARGAVDDLAERKRRILRALKDLEHEHEVGKIDDADFAEISDAYRDQAKDVMREMDADLAPLRERAEEIARAHLESLGYSQSEDAASNESGDDAADATDEDDASADDDEGADASHGADASAKSDDASSRVACAKCGTSNERDAAFCKKCGAAVRAADDAVAKDEKNDATT